VSSASDVSWHGPAGTFNLRPAALDRGDLCGGGEPGHTFRWVPFRELGDLDFRPAGLVTMLPGLDDTVRHVVLDRLDRSPA
jgi:hypothetical protein